MDIKIENLSKMYGSQKAVDDLSFSVKKGEILGFLGPNGAGKTTTMKMITNYIGIDKGDVFFNDKSVKNRGDELKKFIGYLPEHNPLYLDMAVMDYLYFSAELQEVRKEEIPERVKKMIELCGLNKEKHKTIGELSKGYRQRVGLAQAIIHNPEVLILDEPTTGLDPNQIVEIRELIKKIGKEKTVILSSHILPEVEATCDRILIINKGKIVADGTAEDLRNRAQDKDIITAQIAGEDQSLVKVQLSTIPSVEEVRELAENRFEIFSKPSETSAKSIYEMCVKYDWTLTELIPIKTRLEDVFRNLTMN